MKKKIKKEIKKEPKPEKIPDVIAQIEKWLISPPNIISDNLIYEVPPVNKQQKKETEKL